MKVIDPRIDRSTPTATARIKTRGLLPCEHELRVIRGKSLRAMTEYLDAPAAERNYDEPTVLCFHYGFRVVRNGGKKHGHAV